MVNLNLALYFGIIFDEIIVWTVTKYLFLQLVGLGVLRESSFNSGRVIWCMSVRDISLCFNIFVICILNFVRYQLLKFRTFRDVFCVLGEQEKAVELICDKFRSWLNAFVFQWRMYSERLWLSLVFWNAQLAVYQDCYNRF